MAHQPFASAPLRRRRKRARAVAAAHSGGGIACARSCPTTGSTPSTSTSSSTPRPRRWRSSPASSSTCCARRRTTASCGCAGRRASTASIAPGPHRVSLQMRRPRHLWAGDAQARRRPQHGRAAGRRLHRRSRLEERRRARPRRRPRHLAPISQLAGEHGIGVTAILSARSPEFVMAGDLFEKVGDGHRRARHRRHERGGERRGDPRAADRQAESRRVLHLRLQPPVPADEAARQGSTASRARSPWSRSWPAGSAPVTSACARSRWTARRSCAGSASKARCSICRRRSDGRHVGEDRARDARRTRSCRRRARSRPSSRR